MDPGFLNVYRHSPHTRIPPAPSPLLPTWVSCENCSSQSLRLQRSTQICTRITMEIQVCPEWSAWPFQVHFLGTVYVSPKTPDTARADEKVRTVCLHCIAVLHSPFLGGILISVQDSLTCRLLSSLSKPHWWRGLCFHSILCITQIMDFLHCFVTVCLSTFLAGPSTPWWEG